MFPHPKSFASSLEDGLTPLGRRKRRPYRRALPALPDRKATIERGLFFARADQWATLPMAADLETRVRRLLETEFDELFVETAEGYLPRWLKLGREVLITWAPRR